MLGGVDYPESLLVQRSAPTQSTKIVVDHFYTIEVLISAQRAIGGTAYWERVQNSDMSLYQRAECDQILILDYQTARASHGHLNVRLVEVIKTLVAQSV